MYRYGMRVAAGTEEGGVFGGEYVYEWRVDRAGLCMCEWFMSL